MAQLTLYIPDALAAQLKRDARRAKKSLSAHVVERLAGGAGSDSSARDARTKKLRALFGSCDLPVAIEDAPLDEIDGL